MVHHHSKSVVLPGKLTSRIGIQDETDEPDQQDQTFDTSRRNVQYDPTGRTILIRNYASPKWYQLHHASFTLCDRYGLIASQPGFDILEMDLVVLTRLAIVRLRAEGASVQLSCFDIVTHQLVFQYTDTFHDYTHVCHHLAASHASDNARFLYAVFVCNNKVMTYSWSDNQINTSSVSDYKSVETAISMQGRYAEVWFRDDNRMERHINEVNVAPTTITLPLYGYIASRPEAFMPSDCVYVVGGFLDFCVVPKSLANNATRIRVTDKPNTSIPNICNAAVVHIPILNSKVLCLGEDHLFYADDASFISYMCRSFVDAVPHVHVFLEQNKQVQTDESYLVGGDTIYIMQKINDEFARLSMQRDSVWVHGFDTRYDNLSDHVPNKAHDLLDESRMPDKDTIVNMFMNQPYIVDSDGFGFDDPDSDLDHGYVRLYGASLLAGINARIMQAFHNVNLPQSIKHKLRVEKLRALFDDLDDKQVFMTDYLLFYDWLVTATTPDFDDQTRFSIVYAGDFHVRNMMRMIAYLAVCCHSHVVETQILASNLAFCVSDVDQLIVEWQRESHPDFL